mmetsp:Transcript_43779/g.133224  ORF Transcript_43779/g.133224 Transcript_43779/m.133224 type:complete len:408 (+) Transcript_43779:2375-3598(+)
MRAFHRPRPSTRALAPQWIEHQLDAHLIVFGQWQLQERERFESSTLVPAPSARQQALILPREQRHHYAHLSLEVIGPPDVCQFLVRSAVRVRSLDVRLVNDAVEVLREAAEKEGEELLGVVLLVPREVIVEFGHGVLERLRSQRRRLYGGVRSRRRCLLLNALVGIVLLKPLARSLPQLIDEDGGHLGQPSLLTEGVGSVDVVQVAFRGEVIPKDWGVAEALDGRVEVARVAHIVQTDDAVAHWSGAIILPLDLTAPSSRHVASFSIEFLRTRLSHEIVPYALGPALVGFVPEFEDEDYPGPSAGTSVTVIVPPKHAMSHRSGRRRVHGYPLLPQLLLQPVAQIQQEVFVPVHVRVRVVSQPHRRGRRARHPQPRVSRIDLQTAAEILEQVADRTVTANRHGLLEGP